jgi:hypothetical protein
MGTNRASSLMVGLAAGPGHRRRSWALIGPQGEEGNQRNSQTAYRVGDGANKGI